MSPLEYMINNHKTATHEEFCTLCGNISLDAYETIYNDFISSEKAYPELAQPDAFLLYTTSNKNKKDVKAPIKLSQIIISGVGCGGCGGGKVL